MAAIEHPPQDVIQSPLALELPGAPMPIDTRFYVERPPIEASARAAIAKPGGLVRIKAPRKMGKSSLMLRIIHQAAAKGYHTVTVDFQQADTEIFVSLDKFLRWFSANVARHLNIEPNLDNFWDEDMGSKTSCSVYFKGYLLAQIDRPLVLVLNEVNRVFEYPNIAEDFLPLLRFWHEQAKQDKAWQQLRLVVVHSTEIYISLNINQSPFNVGLSLKLPEFTPEQVEDFALRHGLNLSESAIAQLMNTIGGHPYLVHLAFYHLCSQEMTLEELLQAAPTLSGIYGDRLRSHLATLQEQPELAAAFKKVVTAVGSVGLEPLLAYQLESMGLVKLDGNTCTPSCELYRLYFRDKNLGDENYTRIRLKQLEQENQRLQALANLDSLTQVANRRYFDSYLQAECKRMARAREPLSLILCDIDYFKIYNDTYGHQAGDNCLRQVAEAIDQLLKHPANLAARYGGDEFAIVLPETDATNALQIAEEIRVGVKNLAIEFIPTRIGGFPDAVVTVSLGVACTIPSDETDVAKLFDAADTALFQSKRWQRNRVTLSEILDFRF